MNPEESGALISSAYSQALEVIASVEPRIAEATRKELADQRGSLKLIASENYASPAVLMTMGTWFSDKYAEGTVGHRFYAGCQNVDTVESLAAEHARELFGSPYAYVQPHSGIDANLVAFWSILAHRVEGPWLEKFGAKSVNDLSEADWESLRAEFGNQRLLGMSLDAGGHLTHGFRPNISGKMFHQQQYGTDPETGLLDYDVVAAKAREFKPLVLVAGYSAYPRRVDFAKMREIADEVGATLMWTWRTSPAWWPARCSPATRTPCRTLTSRRRRRTSPCVALAAAWCWPRRRSPPPSTEDARWSSVARSRTSWPRRRSPSPRPGSRRSRPTPSPSPTTPSRWQTGS